MRLPCNHARPSVLSLTLLLGILGVGCFKHPTPGMQCRVNDNCPKDYTCNVVGAEAMGTCQKPQDGGAGVADGASADSSATDLGGDGAAATDLGLTAETGSSAEVGSGTDALGPDTSATVDVAPAVLDGGDTPDAPVPDAPAPADLGPVTVDAPGNLPDGSSPVVDTQGPVVWADAHVDTQASVDTPPIVPGPFTVKVISGGNGTGTVTSTSGEISCGATCSATVTNGTNITLRVKPASDSTFVGWSGAGCEGTGDCSVKVAADTEVHAGFALNNSVVVNLLGTGTGGVTSNPAGINCPGDCSEAYAPNSLIELTAAPAPGSVFAGWTGGGCGTATICSVTLTSSTGITATFNLMPYTLNVTASGTGTVVSDPAGINCGTTCAYDFSAGTSVRLTASGSSTSVFTGWSGDCSGTAATCNVTMSAARSVTASFETVTPLTCTTTSTAQSCAGGSIPDINLGSGLGAQACHDRCQVELAADGASTGCWIVAANGDCLCRSGALSDLGSSLHPGGGCTGTAGNLTCNSVTNAVVCTEGAADDDLGSEYTTEQCKSLCEQHLSAKSYTKGCWLRFPSHCYCRRGDIVLGYSGGSCSAH